MKVLLYAECARRLVIGDVHPPWIALVVLCHLTLCSRREAVFSIIFAPDLSPFMGQDRHLRSRPFLTLFRERFCFDSRGKDELEIKCEAVRQDFNVRDSSIGEGAICTNSEQWPNRLHRWALQILISRIVIEP